MIFKNLRRRTLKSKIDHVMTLVFSAAQNRYKNRPWPVGISESGSDIVTAPSLKSFNRSTKVFAYSYYCPRARFCAFSSTVHA